MKYLLILFILISSYSIKAEEFNPKEHLGLFELLFINDSQYIVNGERATNINETRKTYIHQGQFEIRRKDGKPVDKKKIIESIIKDLSKFLKKDLKIGDEEIAKYKTKATIDKYLAIARVNLRTTKPGVLNIHFSLSLNEIPDDPSKKTP